MIKSATYEGRSVNNGPSPDLIEWHRRIAAGGTALTTLAYCAVHPEGQTFPAQICIRPEIIPQLKNFTEAIHGEGAAASVQLAHCGFFTKTKAPNRPYPLAPSRILNQYGIFSGLPWSKEMSLNEIKSTVNHFARAAQVVKESGFDALEIHAGHGYLLSQFLSPSTNHRKDQYGGSLVNRYRIVGEVIQAVRTAVGPGFPILVKMNLSDGFSGGLDLEQAIEVAKFMERDGVNALILSGGFTSKTPFYLLRGGRPLGKMITAETNWIQKLGMILFGPFVVKKYRFEEMFFLDQARKVREAVQMPLALIGGVVSLENIHKALENGFDLVALGRALIYDADFVNKLKSGEIDRSGCNACNECIPEMDRGGVFCVLKPEQKIISAQFS